MNLQNNCNNLLLSVSKIIWMDWICVLVDEDCGSPLNYCHVKKRIFLLSDEGETLWWNLGACDWRIIHVSIK